jgi:hypothetical protein
MQNYSAGVDAPLSWFYEDLLRTFPKAKVIMSTRELNSWFAKNTRNSSAFLFYL